jgi:hypothetical protein
MKATKVFKFNYLLFYFFLFLMIFVNNSYAERFFEKHSTWYEKIPQNATLDPNSANYVNDILINRETIVGNRKGWSVSIFYAKQDTPITIVKINDSRFRDYITLQGWNQVPIPDNAVPPRNAEAKACYPIYCHDGHLVIISHDKKYAWTFFRAIKFDDGSWSTKTVRKWDLTGDGILYPYDKHSSQRFCPAPTMHGVITYDEIQKGYIDHALAFVYHGAKKETHSQVYPCGHENTGGVSDREWAMLGGERIQLDPSVDCNSLGLNTFGKMVCKAMQEYGMIFVDSTGPGNAHIFLENLENQPGKSWDSIYGSLNAIPLNKLRVVEPLMPPFEEPPTTGDNVAPNPPSVLTIQ